MNHALDELVKTALFFWANLTGFAVACVGVVARQISHPDGFLWRRVLLDLPFAMLIAFVTNGIGAYLGHEGPATWGLGGAFAYLGPMFFSDWAKKKFDKDIAKDEPVGEEVQNAQPN